MNNKKKSLPLEVIDLTSSFTLVDHCTLSDTIIDLASDESFDSSVKIINLTKNNPHVTTTSVNTDQTSNISSKKGKKKTSGNIGTCPICLEELGKNPLASTKCGHVFCLFCLEQSMALEKRCPTCRKVLRGKTAFHPLYLSSEN
ncbi:unnamed protein product [Euphydryas editha]|uniref:RING-type domain-containing protein n=1 Tax=Euphydryas editha TaxID=104508 RepID=A0AAU9UV97_EUPED|nr:unnamed protein product [Euphydryas editha]